MMKDQQEELCRRLRAETDQPLMECHQALTAAGWDMKEARKLLAGPADRRQERLMDARIRRIVREELARALRAYGLDLRA